MYRDHFLHQSEVQHLVSTAHDILHRLDLHRNDMQQWSLQDVIDLLAKGYARDQIIAGFTCPVFAD